MEINGNRFVGKSTRNLSRAGTTNLSCRATQEPSQICQNEGHPNGRNPPRLEASALRQHHGAIVPP